MFILLTFLAFLGRIAGIHIIFEIDYMISSIFFLLILKVYGSKGALFAVAAVNGLEYAFFNHGVQPILSFMEVAFVCLIYDRKKKFLVVWDVLYWIFIGSMTILATQYSLTGLINNETYSLIFMCAANGIFNSVLVDILTSYIPFERLCGFENVSVKYHTIATYLIYIAITGILGPFIVYTVLDGRNYEKRIEINAYDSTKNTVNKIIEEISNWSYEDLRALNLKSIIQMGRIEDLIKISTASIPLNIQVIDKNEKVLVPGDLAEDEFYYNLTNGGKFRYISEGFFMWQPDLKSISGLLYDSDGALYMYESEFYNYKMVAILPIKNYRAEYFNTYLSHVRVISLFLILISILILAMNRIVLQYLGRLMNESTGLTEKLRSQEKIEWPDTNIFELKVLTSNFKVMSEDLTGMISDYRKMYGELEKRTYQLLQSEQKLQQLAYYDNLTGLPNRSNFTNHLKLIIEDKKQSESNNIEDTAVIMIDLDRFKQVNDTMGHAAGDLLLNSVAERMNKALSGLDSNNFFIARLGGDEFVTVLNGLNMSEIESVAISLIDSLKKPFWLEGKEVFIGGSLGISVYPYDGDGISDIIKNADIAMYSAKEHGGNKYCFYSQINSLGIPDKMRIENGMHRALKNNDFALYYQPKIDAKSGMLIGAEALIRWHDPENGLISPDRFISLAEKTGLIIPIGEWALREAARQMMEWKRAGYDKLRISVNCSPIQFKNNDLSLLLQNIINETGLDPECLELEITEGLNIENKELVIKELTSIRNMGLSISIDDFGMGYSSLSALKGLPITGLKLDKLFVSNIPFDKHNVAVIKSVLRLAKDINLKVTAEGVETIESVNCLRKMGCDELQGYFFSKPVPPAQFLVFLEERKKSISIDKGWF